MTVPENDSAGRLGAPAAVNMIGRSATVKDINGQNDLCGVDDREGSRSRLTHCEEWRNDSISICTEVDQPWYVVHTKAQQEQVACENLVRQGYTVYLPRIQVLKRSRRQNCQKIQLEPLFPRYLFLRPNGAGHSIAPVRSTLGVTTMVRFGQTLAVLRHSVLSGIQDFEIRQRTAGLEEISPFQIGESVLVVDGPLVGREGLVSSVSLERVVVLMELLGHEARVTMTHHQLMVAN